jgi:hypothetical protein
VAGFLVSASNALAVALATVLTVGACQNLVGIHDYRRDAGTASGGRGGAAGSGDASGGDGVAGRGGSGFDSGPAGASPDAQDADARFEGGQLSDGGDAGPALKGCPSPTTYWTGIAYRLSSGPHSAGNSQGECGFPNSELPSGMAYAAVDHTLFNTMPSCGACLHVEHASDPSAFAEVEVIDASGNVTAWGDHIFALDDAVHDQLMPNGDNPRIKAWLVPCGAAQTIKLVFQSPGGIPAISVFGTRLPLAVVEMKTGASSYAAFTSGTEGSRAIWSPPSGVTSGPNATFRLTDQIGDSVEVTVPVAAGAIDTKVQFAACMP